MAKRGRKSFFKDYMIQEGYKLGALGLTVTEIANVWGISERALYRWEKRHIEFGQAIKRGREEADLSVVSALLKECRENGNITGIIFWLKNRKSDKWRDKKDFEHSGEVSTNVFFNEMVSRYKDRTWKREEITNAN